MWLPDTKYIGPQLLHGDLRVIPLAFITQYSAVAAYAGFLIHLDEFPFLLLELLIMTPPSILPLVTGVFLFYFADVHRYTLQSSEYGRYLIIIFIGLFAIAIMPFLDSYSTLIPLGLIAYAIIFGLFLKRTSNMDGSSQESRSNSAK